MSAIEGLCDVRTELADLNQKPVELAATIQSNSAELGV